MAHIVVRDGLAHTIGGLTYAAVAETVEAVETTLAANNGDSTVADELYFSFTTGNRVNLEVYLLLTVGTECLQAASVRGGMTEVKDRNKHTKIFESGHPAIRSLVQNAEYMVMSPSGAMGLAMAMSPS